MKRSVLPIFALFLLFFTACEDVIDVKLSNENLDLYAVEATITTESNPMVVLYKSLKVNSSDAYPGASGAKVVITDDGQPQKHIELVESTQNRGVYVVAEGQTYFGEKGKTYTLTIEHEGVSIVGSDKLSEVAPIDSIQVYPSLRGDKRFLGVYIYGRETPGLGNFYKWDIYVNNKLLNGAEYLIVVNDELVDGNYVDGMEIFTDFHDPKKKEEERLLKLGYSVQVKQTSISEFAYKYYFQMFNQSQSGGLFSVPPANIKSNFTASNGKPVLGLFTARDISSSNMVIIDEKIESQLNERP